MSRRGITVFSTGNEELDGRLGGGIPHPSFMVIEGEHGTAKTTLVAQIAFGALNSGYKVVVFTTESTAGMFVNQAKLVSIDLTKFYIKGILTVYTLYSKSMHIDSSTVRAAFDRLLAFISSPSQQYDVVMIDSLSLFLGYVGADDVTRFAQTARLAVARGKTIVATVHSEVMDERLAKVLRASSDVYYKLGLANVGGKTVKVLQVVKARGAPEPIEGTVAFDVDPAFGIKIVPIVIAQS